MYLWRSLSSVDFLHRHKAKIKYFELNVMMKNSNVTFNSHKRPVIGPLASNGIQLLDVLQQRRASVHHGLEGVFAAGGNALIRMQQHGQLPVRLVHLLPGNEETGTNERRFSSITGQDRTDLPGVFNPWLTFTWRAVRG